MNTRMEYLYRDASNYKSPNQVIVAGTITEEQKEAILQTLEDGTYFIPEQVGLDLYRGWDITEDDHPFCELDVEKDFYETEEAADDENFTVDDLVAAFLSTGGNGMLTNIHRIMSHVSAKKKAETGGTDGILVWNFRKGTGLC